MRREPKPAQDRSRSPLLSLPYLLVALAVAAPLLAVYFYPYAEGGVIAARIQSYLAAYARIAGAVVGLFQPQVVVNGTTIQGPQFSMQIVKTCDAMDVNILLAAALAAFPMRLWRRLVVALASVLLLTSVNMGRLCALYWVGVHAHAWFDRVHQTVAPLFIVASALAIFLIATQRRSGAAKNAASADSNPSCD